MEEKKNLSFLFNYNNKADCVQIDFVFVQIYLFKNNKKRTKHANPSTKEFLFFHTYNINTIVQENCIKSSPFTVHTRIHHNLIYTVIKLRMVICDNSGTWPIYLHYFLSAILLSFMHEICLHQGAIM